MIIRRLPKTLTEEHAIIKTLWQLVGELNERVEHLEEQLGINSGDSLRPPSQDNLKQRAKRKKKPSSGGQLSAQPGHQKQQREMPPEDQVSQVQRFFPPGCCTCGGEVKPETRASYRHQVFDVPDVKFTVTEYQVYAGTCCQCRHRSVGKLPDWVPSGQMGAALISWIALLSGQYCLSTRQIQSLLQEQWHLGFSLGAISQAQKPVRGWLQPIYAQIGATVRRAAQPSRMPMKQRTIDVASDAQWLSRCRVDFG